MNFTITKEEREFLLALARESIAAKLEGREALRPAVGGAAQPGDRSAPNKTPFGGGAFVSLHLGRGLRGCIGMMSSPEPLEKTIFRMAREAAFSDPRFPPLSRGELERCRIEISVLSPAEPCTDIQKIQIGVHGLQLIHRFHAGVFLPQVPVEQGWDRDEYLDQLCLKAGLPPGSHREKGARLLSFTALVFAEA